jgi:hypothetical protein
MLVAERALHADVGSRKGQQRGRRNQRQSQEWPAQSRDSEGTQEVPAGGVESGGHQHAGCDRQPGRLQHADIAARRKREQERQQQRN